MQIQPTGSPLPQAGNPNQLNAIPASPSPTPAVRPDAAQLETSRQGKSLPKVLIPLPDKDFDTTEVVVPWHTLRRAGYEVVFATEHGKQSQCDPLLLTGVIFGQLGARPENVALYRELERDPAFQKPISYSAIHTEDYAGLILPGGHAPGMRQYLGSTALQQKVVGFFQAGKPVGAICHGPVVLARTIDPATGKSVIHGKRVTALTKRLEKTAFFLTAWKLGRYYRTYPAYVQDEVAAAQGDRRFFQKGPWSASYNKPFVVQDGKLVTARWPGDAQGFADRFVALLQTESAALRKSD